MSSNTSNQSAASSSTSSGDQGNFNKFCKYFTTRVIQGVVQSRLGHKLRSEYSGSTDSTDWFNIKLGENGEVTSEIRASTSNRFPPIVKSVCLDFHVRTAEGQMLPLECWCVSFDDGECDPSVSVRGQLYHQMSTLLKSALCTARVTPAYRYYARKQGMDSFIICYQIYVGDAAVHDLGDGYKTVSLGYLPSPFGTLRLHLHLRTKMVLSGSEDTIETKLDTTSASHEGCLRPVNSELAVSCASSTLPNSSDSSFARYQGANVPFGGLLPESPVESPCFSVFSASPASLHDPWGHHMNASPDKRMRNTSVTFQMGTPSHNANAQSGSSESTSSTAGVRPTAVPVVTTQSGSSSTGSSSAIGTFHSSSSGGCLFGMEISSSAYQPRAIRLPATSRSTLATGSGIRRGQAAEQASPTVRKMSAGEPGRAGQPAFTINAPPGFGGDIRPASLPNDTALSRFTAGRSSQRSVKPHDRQRRVSSSASAGDFPFSQLVTGSHSEPTVCVQSASGSADILTTVTSELGNINIRRSHSAVTQGFYTSAYSPSSRLPRVNEHSPPGSNGNGNGNGSGANTERQRAHTVAADATFDFDDDGDDDDLDSSGDSGFVKIPLAAVDLGSGALGQADASSSKGSDLGELVQQCKLAPSTLRLFAEIPDSPEATILQSGGDAVLPAQLELYAKQMSEFDAFVSGLADSPNEN